MNKLFVILCATGCLLACQSAPPIQYYVLEPIETAIPSNEETTGPKNTIGIGPITIPGLLDRKKIVTRGTNNAVQIAEFQQWAMPIQDNVAETLAHNLGGLQPASLFRIYPWSAYGLVDVQIVIDILRFDATPGKSVNLEAIWAIKDEKNQKSFKTGRTTLQQALPDSTYPGIVRGLSNILWAFSQDLNIALLKAVNTNNGELNFN